jgi:hypothetical protein
MAQVLLSADDITVLGGPSVREVNVNFGPRGSRGSQIFVGIGKPSIPGVLGETPQIFDMYINLLASDNEYLFLYQYVTVDGTPTWLRLLRLIPNTYLANLTGNFVDGRYQVFIPVINVVPLSGIGNVTSANFNVQHTVVSSNPVASSITVGDLDVVDGIIVLPITVSAAEFDGTNWSLISTQKPVQFLITIV